MAAGRLSQQPCEYYVSIKYQPTSNYSSAFTPIRDAVAALLRRWLFFSCPSDLVCRERGPWRLNMCLENVDCATSKPGFSSSP